MRSGMNRRRLLGAGLATVAAPSLVRAQTAEIFTVVGNGAQGMAREGDRPLAASVDQPFGVLIDPDGALIWADFGSNRILKLRGGRISVVAGNGAKGHAGDGGPAKLAELSTPHEIRFDRKGNMLIAERDSHVIRLMERRTGRLSTIAGTGMPGYSGDDGPAAQAQLSQPHSIALDRDDNLYICDIRNNRVRRRDAATGILTTFAGNGEAADTPDEAPLTAPLRGPRSIDIGPDGTLYLILREGNKVLRIDPNTKMLSRIAGTGAKGYSGDGGPARDSTWNGPKGIAYAPDGSLYIADTENHVIRKVSLRDQTVTTVAGTGARGDGPDGDPRKCALARPHGLYVHKGLLYIGDSENHRVRALRI